MVGGITCHGIYKSEGCEFIYTVTSQALSYPTRRSGLAGSEYKGVLDRGFSSCAVLAFCHSPGILSCMWVYALPMDHREVTESKGTTEVASGLCEVERQRIESRIVSRGWKILRGARLKLKQVGD